MPARGTLTGSQIATTRVVPPGRGCDDAARLAAHLGLSLFPWQREVLTTSAILRPDGRWAAFENVLIAPRQVGKSHIVVARALAGALLYHERLILYSAHEYRTAQETWLLMRELCRSDAVAPYVKRVTLAAGMEAVEFNNGARFRMIARTKSSVRGFSPDVYLADECFALNPDMMASILPALSARPNPQVYYLSSAGTWQSEVLLGLRKRGHSRTAAHMAYWEWHADPDDDIHAERTWRKANPSYGVLQTRDSVERELESLTRQTFMRERLGIWSESFTETAMDEDDVIECTIDVPPPPRDGRAVTFGVDVNKDRTGSAIVAAYRDDDGFPVVVLIDARPGAGWVPERLGELAATYPNDGFAYDHRGGIVDLMDRAARDHDVSVLPLKYNEYPAACAGFTQAVADKAIRIGRAPVLVTDCVQGTARMMTNGWVWDRKVTTPPVHLIAATCALYALDHGTGASSVGIF